MNRRNITSFILLTSILTLVRIFLIWSAQPKQASSTVPDSLEYLQLSEQVMSAYSLTSSTLPYLSLRRTPIYPFFLSLFKGKNELIAVLTAQQLLVFLISLSTYFLARRLFDARISFIAGLLIMVEPAIFVESLMLLTETLFTAIFLLSVLTFAVGQKNQSYTASLGSGILLGLACLVRPGGQVVGFLLVLYSLAQIVQRRGIHGALPALGYLLVIVPWAVRNYFNFGVMSISSIDSHNLHLFEGAGAEATARSINLDEVHKIETNQLIKELGENYSLADEQKYRIVRGFQLIFQYPLGFLVMHMKGIFQILLGPCRGELVLFLSDGQRVQPSSNVEKAAIMLSTTLTLLIFIFAIIGMGDLIKQSKFLVLVFFVLLFASSGYQAYGRFRAPLAPIMCIAAASGILQIYSLIRKKRLPWQSIKGTRISLR